MKRSALLLACGIALASCPAWAGGRGGGHWGGHAGGARPGGHQGAHHGAHRHAHARVFIAAPLFVNPYPYSYYPAPAYSGPPPPPPIYIEQPGPAAEYWFCPGSGGYYPQVTDCPGGWQRVLPEAIPQASFPG